MRIAITRAVSRSIINCELTHLSRQPIDLERARAQHKLYEAALIDLGCKVISLPEEAELPDAVFVEDPAVVLDGIAIITRPGAESRRAESDSIALALSPYRKLTRIDAPGTLDGGDVLVAGRTIFIGITLRTNPAAIQQFRQLAEPHGYQVISVGVFGCLHLKSAVTLAGDKTLLLNPDWVDPDAFPGFATIAVDPNEPGAANVLRVGDKVLIAAAYPNTRTRLATAGIESIPVEASELAKAEGALTCCSLIFEV